MTDFSIRTARKDDVSKLHTLVYASQEYQKVTYENCEPRDFDAFAPHVLDQLTEWLGDDDTYYSIG